MRFLKKYNIVVRYTIIIVLFVISSIVISCRSSSEKEHVKTISNLLGKNIIIPNRQIVLNNFEIDTINENYFNNTIKFVSFTDGRCHACIEKLLELMSLKNEFNNQFSDNIDFVNFVYVENVKSFIKDYYPMIDYTMPLLLVDNYDFLKNNQLPSSPLYHVFLLNKNNEIILVGNPTISKDLKVLYIKQINQQLNKGNF